MALIITTNNEQVNKYVQEYYVDTLDDIQALRTDIHPGSEATVIENGAKFILNSNHEWTQLTE